MALFKVHHVLLVITVCKHFRAVTGAENLAKQNDAVARNERIDMLVWLQRFDRGCVAKPNTEVQTMRTMSLNAVNDLVQETYVELQCSYAYFALTYLHLISIYISHPMTLIVPTEEELDGLSFSEESATMVALVHTNPDQQWNSIKAVMWLFHTFVEKTSYLMETDRNDYPDLETVYKSMIWPYNAIKILLEEFTVATGCKAYDQVTGRPDNLSYVDKIRNVTTGDRQSVIAKLSSYKNRFWAQTEWNEHVGFNPCVDTSTFFFDNLLLGTVRDDGEMTVILENTFGVQLEWQSIRLMLDYCYGQVMYGITEASVQEYVNALLTYQYRYISLLKAIAMRIVIVYLLQLRHAIETVPVRFLPCFMNHNKRVAHGLQAFVDCTHFHGDQHLKAVIDSMNKLSDRFEIPEQIDKLLVDIQELLEDMSSPVNEFGVRFDEPMVDNVNIHTHAANAAIELARHDGFNIPEDTENVVVIEVYVEFVKRMANFDVVYLFAQLTTTAEFRRLVELEMEEQRNRS